MILLYSGGLAFTLCWVEYYIYWRCVQFKIEARARIINMTKSIKIGLIGLVILFGLNVNAQIENSKSEINQITETLMDYIEGTTNGEPNRLRRAFHPDFNLYRVTTEDSLRIRSGEKYISNVKEGEKSNSIGRIISIDYEKDAAIAKAEILILNWRVFTDYFLLLKYEDSWKIVYKSYTWREIPKKNE
jgi:hypothetical protein